MGDFRIRYGYALGPEGTYSTRSDKTVFPESATTPDVTTGVLFYSQNTTNTAITYFNVLGGGGQPGDGYHQGKVITVFYKDGSTSVVSAGQMFLLDTGATGYPAGTVATYLLHNSAWYELSRTYPTQSPFLTPAVTAVAGSFSINVTTANVFVLNATAATAVLTSFSGGYPGQVVYISPNSSNNCFVTGNVGGNIRLAGTGAFVMNQSGVYEFLFTGSEWKLLKGSAAN